jgi:hypothetical protein
MERDLQKRHIFAPKLDGKIPFSWRNQMTKIENVEPRPASARLRKALYPFSSALWCGIFFAASFALTSSSSEAQGAPGRKTLPSLVRSLHNSIARCWYVPPDTGSLQDVVRFQLEFRRDGSLAREPVLLNPKEDAGFMRLAETARRAINRCAPYAQLKQHADAYKSWRVLVVNFHRPGL